MACAHPSMYLISGASFIESKEDLMKKLITAAIFALISATALATVRTATLAVSGMT